MTTFRSDIHIDPATPAALRLGATIDVRQVDAAGGAIVTVAGSIDRTEATRLGRCLHGELDAEPTVLVINLSRVLACAREGVEVLTAVRDRAREADVALHLLHLGSPMAQGWLAAAGLDRA